MLSKGTAYMKNLKVFSPHLHELFAPDFLHLFDLEKPANLNWHSVKEAEVVKRKHDVTGVSSSLLNI